MEAAWSTFVNEVVNITKHLALKTVYHRQYNWNLFLFPVVEILFWRIAAVVINKPLAAINDFEFAVLFLKGYHERKWLDRRLKDGNIDVEGLWRKLANQLIGVNRNLPVIEFLNVYC